MKNEELLGIFDLGGLEEKAGITLDDLFYLKNLQQRKLYLEEDVSQDSVGDLVHQIMQINYEDREIPPEERKPIRLYISSCGGDVDAGFSLIDAITLSKTPIYTINTGYEYSMGFLIGITGHKRFAFPSSKFLLHDGTSFIGGSVGKMQDQAGFTKKLEASMKLHVLNHTNITQKQYSSKQRSEWYIFTQEAKDLGVVDYIIGVDCELEEII